MGKSVGMFIGSTMGDTWDAGERIARRFYQALGQEVPMFDIDGTELKQMEQYDLLLVGSPTWDIGQLQTSWRIHFEDLDDLNLEGKRVAMFGSGDQLTYDDTFQDAMGIVAEKLEERGARLVGMWPVDGYSHTGSLAQRGDHFVGLALDFDNQADRTDERVNAWVDALLDELGWLPVGTGAEVGIG